MLVEHFSRNEWEMIILLSLALFLLLVLSKLVIKLLLVIEEEELILQNVGASNLHSILLLEIVLDSVQGITFFFQPSILLKLSVVQLFSHLLKMRLQDVFVCELLAKLDPFSEFKNITWIF